MSPLNFSGKTALVVGGSSGIGNGIAQAFSSCGAEVHVWGTRKQAADYSPDDGSNLTHLHYSQLDVADIGAIEAYANPFPKLDILVLAQGTVIYQRGEFQMAGFRRVIDVNLNSLMACGIKYHDMLAESHGCIITIGSTAAFQATLGNPAYNASKAGVVGLTRSLAAAWAKDGIRVNSIAPGLVDTKLTKVTVTNPQRHKAALQRIPLGRLGTPQDIAGAALFLASPLAGYVIGHTIPVDGGLILGW
jgi:3-oxoacyl-[acyl-carrier protein] reductase